MQGRLTWGGGTREHICTYAWPTDTDSDVVTAEGGAGEREGTRERGDICNRLHKKSQNLLDSTSHSISSGDGPVSPAPGGMLDVRSRPKPGPQAP